jgi:hypothetical protein
MFKQIVILLSVGACGSALASQCVVAGRLDDAARWAPRISAVELYNAQGTRVSASDKNALSTVTQMRVIKPVPLSTCNFDAAIAKVDDFAAPLGASKPGYLPITKGSELVPVKGIKFPAIRSGRLVEIEVSS